MSERKAKAQRKLSALVREVLLWRRLFGNKEIEIEGRR